MLLNGNRAELSAKKEKKNHTTQQSYNNASTRYSIARKRTAVTKVTSTILGDQK